ncbi:MAG: GLPGLI family protein [Polaribacter sp.]|jgi:GLPGLI family protein
MKNTITILCLFLVHTITGQNFQGKAVYKTSRKMNLNIDDGSGSKMSDVQKAQMNAMMMKQFQKTFVLTFDKTSSMYKEEKNLKAPVARQGGNMVMILGDGGGNDVVYKNVKENRFVNKTEIMGKLFLIKDELPKYEWKLTGETKNIGIYTCYKATYTREEERASMNVEDGEVTEKKNKVDVVTTAWYAPSIPVSNGPANYTGLPGLILEIREGNQTIICSEIGLNPKEKIIIEEPSKGKKVSQSQYEKIMAKKSKEMMEKFKSRRKDGNSIEIRIDG